MPVVPGFFKVSFKRPVALSSIAGTWLTFIQLYICTFQVQSQSPFIDLTWPVYTLRIKFYVQFSIFMQWWINNIANSYIDNILPFIARCCFKMVLTLASMQMMDKTQNRSVSLCCVCVQMYTILILLYM